jgi:hypothetical protein
MTLSPAPAAHASAISDWCADEVNSVGQQVAPFRSRLGNLVTLTLITTAAQRAEIGGAIGLDSTGLTLGTRRSSGEMEAEVVIDCTAVSSKSQLTAVRFLALHEIAHALQFVSQPDPNARPADDYEYEADCAANIMIKQIYGNSMPLSYGAHGGCPTSMFEATATWLDSLTAAPAPAKAKAKRATGKLRKTTP